MARNSVCKKSVIFDAAGVAIGHQWEFADGAGVEVMLADLSDAMYARSAAHGLGQKGGDSYSGISQPGPARAALEATLDAIMANEWNRRADAIGILAEALARVTGQDMEDVIAKLQEMDDKAKKDLAKHPKIKVAVKEIELERLEAKADEDAPLDF